MKIIYLHQYFITPSQPGATRSYEMARRLVSYGHEVHMITSESGWMTRAEEAERFGWKVTDEAGITVHWYPVPYSNHMGFLGRVKAFLSFMIKASFRGMTLDADIVFASSSPLTIAIPGIFISKRKKIPMVFEVRDLWPEAPIQLGYLNNPVLRIAAKWLEKLAYRNAANVVALSPGMTEGVIAAGKAENHVFTIPNSSDNGLFEQFFDDLQTRKELGLTSDDFFVLYCGTFGHANGLHYVIDAARILKERGDEKVKLVLIGDGKEKDALVARVKNENLENVKIYDPIPKDDIPKLFSACDLTAVIFENKPILWTCSPNKLFDSFAASKAFVTNTKGWMRGLADDYKCGVYVDPENPQEYAEQLIKLSENRALLDGMGRNGKKLAETKFNRDLLAKEIESVLLQSLKD